MNRQRSLDISESYYLLLELICTEPIIQQTFSIIDSVCLSHGVKILNNTTPEFQRHLDMHWMPFLRAAVRAMHAYGFVPWRLMTLPTGDKVPEVLPAGTFRWTTEVSKDNDAMLSYVVRLNPGTRPEPNIRITPFMQPSFMVTEQSIMYATVSSPMSSAIESFKNLQAAIKRQSHADAWNCTARVIIAHEPKDFAHDQQRRELFETLSFRNPFAPTVAADANEVRITETFADRSMNHIPAVYTLPPHHHIETMPPLAPCMDIPFLHNKYKHDVCALVGVPPEMLPGLIARSCVQSTRSVHAIKLFMSHV